MVSYNYILFGMAIAIFGAILILLQEPIDLFMTQGAQMTTSPEAESGRDFVQSIVDGLPWVALILGMIFVLAGALEDRARGI